ncbi:MAG: hypothetical protein PHF00_09825 [Elusimicrobia bacterium]|nr:hypothetical protein [Elusimicrobiota bacterium]
MAALLVICAQTLQRHHNKSLVSPAEKQTLRDSPSAQGENFDGTETTEPYGGELRKISEETKEFKKQKAAANIARQKEAAVNKVVEISAAQRQTIEDERAKLGQQCASLIKDYQSHDSKQAFQQAQNSEKQYVKYRIPFSAEFQGLINNEDTAEAGWQLREEEQMVKAIRIKALGYLKDIPECVQLNKVIANNSMSINYALHYGDRDKLKREFYPNEIKEIYSVRELEGALCLTGTLVNTTAGQPLTWSDKWTGSGGRRYPAARSCKYKMMIITISWSPNSKG